MAVVIRMKRIGRRKRPCYRISVTDSRWKRDGKTLATLGLYDPVAPSPDLQVKLDVDRAREWLGRGAVPSFTVRSILRRQGVYEGIAEPGPERRTGRYKTTKTRTRERRDERKARLAERKAARRTERAEAKRSAAASAPADASPA